MFKTFKKTRLLISIVFLVVLLTAMVFLPQVSRLLSISILTFGVGMGIFLTVCPDWMCYRQGKIPYRQLMKVIAINLTGLLFAFGSAVLVGGWIGRLASQSAWDAGWPEWAVIAAGIFSGFAAGFAAGGLVRFLWGVLFKTKRVKTAQADGG